MSSVDVCLCLLDSILSSRSADYKQLKSLNCAPPPSSVFNSCDSSSLLSNVSYVSGESVPSLSSFPVSPGSDIQHSVVFPKEPSASYFLPRGCNSPYRKLVEDDDVLTNGDNIGGRPSQPGTRQESKDEDHCTEVLQWMTKSNVSENSLNFDFTVGVLRQKDDHVEADVPCTEGNECSLVQVHVPDRNLSQEIVMHASQLVEGSCLKRQPGMCTVLILN